MKIKTVNQKQVYTDLFNDLLKALQKEYKDDYIITKININKEVDGAIIYVEIYRPSQNDPFWLPAKTYITKIYKYDDNFNFKQIKESEKLKFPNQ